MEGRIYFNNQSYLLTEFATIGLPKNLEWAEKSQEFVKNWINGDRVFQMQTSGSTGKPKNILLSREQMEASAKATIDFLNLDKGVNALLCMNPDFIGGRMMMVRALVGGWNLFVLPPSSEPIIEAPIHFAAMVPLQVGNLLNSKKGQESLNRIEKLIIGGAPITSTVEAKLSELKTEVFQTFGMTETVSHIALKKLNGSNKSEYYQMIGDNQIKQDESGCLMVKGTVTSNEWITTNDMVEISGGTFQWLGRSDLVVNSGGIKIQILPLEEELSEVLKTDVLLWKEEDEKLGEKLIGLIRNQETLSDLITNPEAYKTLFKPYHFPKKWYFCPSWEQTKSGKIDRKSTWLKASSKD